MLAVKVGTSTPFIAFLSFSDSNLHPVVMARAYRMKGIGHDSAPIPVRPVCRFGHGWV